MVAPGDPAPMHLARMPHDVHFGYAPATVIAARIACREISGVQMNGRFADEATVIAASATFEAAQPWAHLRPPELA